MPQTIQAKSLTLHEIKHKFGLSLTRDDDFFPEWTHDLPTLTDAEIKRLDDIRNRFWRLTERPMLESMVKMLIVSPLLELAGFYDDPFYPLTEKAIRIAEEMDGEIIQGRIDLLVMQEQFWVALVETKPVQSDVMVALPQALFYMLGNPHTNRPIFGMLSNGREQVFLKLLCEDVPRYALSDAFSLMNRENGLYSVLRILKRLSKLLAA